MSHHRTRAPTLDPRIRDAVLDNLRDFHRGPDAAITKRVLAQAICLRRPSDARHIDSSVQELRAMEFPIGSGHKGYFYAENSGQLASTEDHLSNRIRHQRETRLAIRRIRRKMAKQRQQRTLFEIAKSPDH